MALNSVVCTPQFQYDESKLKKTSNDKQSMAKNALQMKTSLQTGYRTKKKIFSAQHRVIYNNTTHIAANILYIHEDNY